MGSPLSGVEYWPDYIEYLLGEIDQSPKVDRCAMCDGEFEAIFYFDMKWGDWFWSGYCSEECEEIQGQIDKHEEEQLKKVDLQMYQWAYWGRIF